MGSFISYKVEDFCYFINYLSSGNMGGSLGKEKGG